MKSEIEINAAVTADFQTALGAFDRVVALYDSPDNRYSLERERAMMIRRMIEWELGRETLDHRLEILHTQISELREYLQALEDRLVHGGLQDIPKGH